MSEEIETAERYRRRAEQLRAIATSGLSLENQTALLSVAEEYERMADSLISRCKQQPSQEHG